MIAEVVAEAYDSEGREVFRPSKKQHRSFAPTFPMGRYITQPLKLKSADVNEMREFLKGCRYVPDQRQFNKLDYWMAPEEFEERKRGDCDDFSLWTWRQLLGMGYDARFVYGHAGKYGYGHAWVTFAEGGRTFLVEPLAAWLGPKLPRLSTVRYRPRVSVRWDGERLHYYEHEKKTYNPSLWRIMPLLAEWLVFWTRKWPKMTTRMARAYYLWVRFYVKRFL